jgi:hypothetical protein
MSISHLTDPNNQNRLNLYVTDISCNTLSATNINSSNILFDNLVCNNFELTSATSNGYVLSSDPSGVGTWHASAGGVVNLSTSTNTALARFNGLTGKIIENSSVLLDNSGNLSTNSISVSGFTLSTSPTSGYALTSDASGIGTWNVIPVSVPSTNSITWNGPFSAPLAGTLHILQNGKAIQLNNTFSSNLISVSGQQITCSLTLPSNLRPSYEQQFKMNVSYTGGNNEGTLVIQPNGTIIIAAGAGKNGVFGGTGTITINDSNLVYSL